MKLNTTEKEALRKEFIKRYPTIELFIFNKQEYLTGKQAHDNILEYLNYKIDSILEKKEKDIVEMIESLKALNPNEGIIVEDFITKTGLRLRNDTIDEIINKLNNK
jgi:hypothetical protein